MSNDPPRGVPVARGTADSSEGLNVDAATATISSGRVRREIRRGAAALACDLWGRGPERCEVHSAGPDLLLVVFHGGLTPAESSLKRAGEFDEVDRSRDNFRRAMEPRLGELVERLTGRVVHAALGASRLDPDMTIEALVLVPVTPASAPDPLAERLRAAEADARTISAHAVTEVDSASAASAQAAQARRHAQEVWQESQATRKRRAGPDAERD
jgi:uncharacterized protein YbcI